MRLPRRLLLLALATTAACEQSITFPLPDVTAGGAAIEIDGMLYPGMAAIRSLPTTEPSRMIVLTTSDLGYQFHISAPPGRSIGEDFPLGDMLVATPTRVGFTLERLVAAPAEVGFSFVGDGSFADAGSMRIQASAASNLSGFIDARVRGPAGSSRQRLRIRFAAIAE